jgi:DNA-binding CsgD family transcriptional regulator
MGERKNAPTRQELQVIRAVAEYGTVSEAAKALVVSPHTVDAHLDHLRQKTGLHKAVQLVAWAARNGWLDDEPATAVVTAREEIAESGEGKPQKDCELP